MTPEDREVRRLAVTLAGVLDRLRALETGGSRTTSVSGNLTIRDPNTGQAVLIIGQLPDGTVGVITVTGNPPPTPPVPVVESRPGGVLVRWNGTWPTDADGGVIATPADMAGMQVHVGDNAEFTPTTATLHATFPNTGGAVFVPLSGVAFVRLVARTAAALTTAGTAVEVAPADVPVDTLADGPAGTTLSMLGGEPTWTGNTTLLIEAGGSVPLDTDPGTIIFQKAE